MTKTFAKGKGCQKEKKTKSNGVCLFPPNGLFKSKEVELFLLLMKKTLMLKFYLTGHKHLQQPQEVTTTKPQRWKRNFFRNQKKTTRTFFRF